MGSTEGYSNTGHVRDHDEMKAQLIVEKVVTKPCSANWGFVVIREFISDFIPLIVNNPLSYTYTIENGNS